MPSNKGKVIPVADLAEASLVPGVGQRHEGATSAAVRKALACSDVLGVFLLQGDKGGATHPWYRLEHPPPFVMHTLQHGAARQQLPWRRAPLSWAPCT